MSRTALVLAVAALLLSPPLVAAQSVEMEEALQAVGDGRLEQPPLRLAERSAAPVNALAAAIEAAPGQLADLARWNREGGEPARIGFARSLPAALEVDLAAAAPDPSVRAGEAVAHAGGLLSRTAAGELVWGARFEVADAHRLRLHLTEVELPPGTRMWVYGDGNEVVPFGLDLSGPDRSLWTPSVGGGAIHLEVRVPGGAGTGAKGTFGVGEVAEIFRLDGEGRPLTAVTPTLGLPDVSCLVDAQCVTASTFDVIEGVQQATAHLQFVVGSSVFICTGGLMNDNDPATVIPFLQTANHCISSQAVAGTLEAFWDYYTPFCGGPAPNLGGLPRSTGATLLATGASSDFTLLRLGSIPPNRGLLGWNASTAAAGPGTVLHRVSHPFGFPQIYARTRVDAAVPACSGAPRPRYLYQKQLFGGTMPGGSGAPVIRAGGQMVGQLRGGCGPNTQEGCLPSTHIVDGAFSTSFAAEGPFLTGSGTGSPPCVESPTTLCLHDNRFKVEVVWENSNDAGQGAVLSKLSDASGVFYFFNPNNAEMLVKVLDACVAPFNRYWVFYAATTNVEFTVTVTDTQEDVVKIYQNALGQAALPVQDTQAFATCP